MKLTVYFLFVSILLLSRGPCFCQDNQYNMFLVRIAPLNLFDPLTGVIQLGVENRLNRRIAISVDYGLKFDKLSFQHNGSERKDYRYSKDKVEVKYFLATSLKKDINIDHFYLAVQGFYFPQKYRKYNDWLSKNGKSYHYDISDINRKVMVVSFLAGAENTSGRFVYDFYYGLGIRQMTIRHHTMGEIERTLYRPIEFSFHSVDQQEGVFYRPHISMGFKIGYIINSKH